MERQLNKFANTSVTELSLDIMSNAERSSCPYPDGASSMPMPSSQSSTTSEHQNLHSQLRLIPSPV